MAPAAELRATVAVARSCQPGPSAEEVLSFEESAEVLSPVAPPEVDEEDAFGQMHLGMNDHQESRSADGHRIVLTAMLTHEVIPAINRH